MPRSRRPLRRLGSRMARTRSPRRCTPGTTRTLPDRRTRSTRPARTRARSHRRRTRMGRTRSRSRYRPTRRAPAGPTHAMIRRGRTLRPRRHRTVRRYTGRTRSHPDRTPGSWRTLPGPRTRLDCPGTHARETPLASAGGTSVQSVAASIRASFPPLRPRSSMRRECCRRSWRRGRSPFPRRRRARRRTRSPQPPRRLSPASSNRSPMPSRESGLRARPFTAGMPGSGADALTGDIATDACANRPSPTLATRDALHRSPCPLRVVRTERAPCASASSRRLV